MVFRARICVRFARTLGDKKTSCVDTENKLNGVYRKNYRIRLDHQILTDHGVFYPQALYNDLIFELTPCSCPSGGKRVRRK